MARVKTRFGHEADFPAYWRGLKDRLETGLVRWIPKFFGNLSAGQIKTVRAVLADGKRIRGSLVCLVSDALRGRIEDAIPRAVAIECIQAASLIHDDYVDDDTRRRNHAATWTVEGPRKAVLLGDLIFATAIEKMMEISRWDGLAVAEAIATMANGAYQEPMDPLDLARAAAEGRFRPALYHRIVHLKTGALFGAAVKVGAIAAGATSAVRALAFEWGARVGEAFQIADDLEEIVTIASRPKTLAATIPRLAPLYLCFSKATNFDSSCLAAGREADFCAWFRNARPTVEKRMLDEIAARLGLAAEALRVFPAAADTRMLRAAPSTIVRLATKKIGHSKTVPICGR